MSDWESAVMGRSIANAANAAPFNISARRDSVEELIRYRMAMVVLPSRCRERRLPGDHDLASESVSCRETAAPGRRTEAWSGEMGDG
ncbi:hypothetical protein D3C81_1817590 [compost metagenome]